MFDRQIGWYFGLLRVCESGRHFFLVETSRKLKKTVSIVKSRPKKFWLGVRGKHGSRPRYKELQI